MKLLLSCSFCCVFLFSFGQKGFEVIEQAEKQIEKGNYKKAEKLLNKADSMDYGFCGLAWGEARSIIAINRCKIRAGRGEYLLAANQLNNTDYWNSYELDTLKMTYFIRSLGKEIIKREIDSCLEAIVSVDSTEWMDFELTLYVGFSEKPLIFSYETSQMIFRDVIYPSKEYKEKTLIDRFRLAVKKQYFYQLLL
ncbi:hypothetical protein D3C87_21400 [compost metagenome]